MAYKRVKLDACQCRCERCGHRWISYGPDPPLRCAGASCKTPYWNTKPSRPARRPPRRP